MVPRTSPNSSMSPSSASTTSASISALPRPATSHGIRPPRSVRTTPRSPCRPSPCRPGYGRAGEAHGVAQGAHERPWLRRLQLWGGLLLGGVLLGWFLWSIDWRELVSVLVTAKVEWLVLAAVVMLLDYVVHAWRWKVLLRHVDPTLDWNTLLTASAVLWAFNTLLPLRAGNLLRPAVVATRRNLPYTTLLFTHVAESVCDVFGIVILVLVMLRMLP